MFILLIKGPKKLSLEQLSLKLIEQNAKLKDRLFLSNLLFYLTRSSFLKTTNLHKISSHCLTVKKRKKKLFLFFKTKFLNYRIRNYLKETFSTKINR